jgi:DNA-binding response OmpR family regulator
MLSQQTILVVDDDELLARMVAELLRVEGYEVWTARDGLQGYSSYYQHEAQTVVTDIDMPELGGFEMMRCIRAINPCARAIYMSGAPEQYRRTLVTEAQDFGAGVLRKPFEGIELLKLIPSLAREKIKPGSYEHEWSPDQKKLVWKEAANSGGKGEDRTQVAATMR